MPPPLDESDGGLNHQTTTGRRTGLTRPNRHTTGEKEKPDEPQTKPGATGPLHFNSNREGTPT